MTAEAWVAAGMLLTTVLGAVGFNLVMVARWTQSVEAEQRRQEDRIDQLYARDERIFTKLDEVLRAITKLQLWIAREEGKASAGES